MAKELKELLKKPWQELSEIEKIQIKFNSYFNHNYCVEWNLTDSDYNKLEIGG